MNFASIACALSLVMQPVPADATPTEETPTEEASTEAEDNGWEEAPQPKPQPQPEAAPTPSPPPPRFEATPASQQPVDNGRPARLNGTGFIIGGAVSLGVGAISLVFIALPAAIVKTVALDRASRDPLLGNSTREDRYRRARNADDAMEAGFWIGITGIGLGIPLIITGAVLRSKSRSRAAQRITPTANGLAVRF